MILRKGFHKNSTSLERTLFVRAGLLIVASLVTAPAFAMGPKKPKVPPPRVLKKIVTLGKIKSQGIQVDKNGTFDLENAINRQFASAVLSTNRYTIKVMGRSGIGTLATNAANNSIQLMGYNDSPQDPNVCLPSAASINLSGEVISFEFESANGVKFGFNSGGLIGPALNTNVRVAKSRMSAVFEATDPTGAAILGSANVSSTQTETTINADVSFYNFLLGFEHYKASPIASVSYKALTNGVTALASQTDNIPWEGMVIATDTRRYLAINAGVDAGVQVGDEFQVRNVTHYWKGTPCHSQYVQGRPDRLPVVKVKVTDVQSTYSWTEVTEFLDPESMAMPGAKVSIEKLVPPAQN